MIHRLLAVAVLVLQLAFIVLVVAGGLFLLHWPSSIVLAVAAPSRRVSCLSSIMLP